MSAYENVAFIMELLSYSKKETEDRTMELLTAMEIADKAHQRPNQMSGGQQQRVAVARALVNQPEIVWGDEPTGNLDSTNSEEIMDLLTRLNKENGQTFILVTHSEAVAARAHRIVHMADGVIVNSESREP